jgi:hypothetical protein
MEPKAFQTFVRIYSLSKCEWLNAKIQLIFHDILIRSVITYACPAWKFAVDIRLMIIKRLQNKALSKIRKFPKITPIRYMHMAIKIP